MKGHTLQRGGEWWWQEHHADDIGPWHEHGPFATEWEAMLDLAEHIKPTQSAAGAGDFAPRAWRPEAAYYRAGGYDSRDLIEAFGLNYNRGVVVKYIVRAGRKPGNAALLDLYKAREHILREIAHVERLDRAGAAPAEAPYHRHDPS